MTTQKGKNYRIMRLPAAVWSLKTRLKNIYENLNSRFLWLHFVASKQPDVLNYVINHKL